MKLGLLIYGEEGEKLFVTLVVRYPWVGSVIDFVLNFLIRSVGTYVRAGGQSSPSLSHIPIDGVS